MADPGSQSFSGGCTGFQTGSSLEYSTVIGRTDNIGEPSIHFERLRGKGSDLKMTFNRTWGKSPWSTLTGVGIYQGPMYIKHSYFDRFQTVYWNDTWTKTLGKRPVSHAAALSVKKDSTYPTYTSQYIVNLTFGFCDDKNDQHFFFVGTPDLFDWTFNDGPKNAMTYDRDGSLTGTPNTVIVRTRPFFLSPSCVTRKDWGVSICPDRFVKLEVKGSDGSLGKGLKDNWALIGYRDDAREDPFYQKAQQRLEYLVRVHTSYIIGFNTSLQGAAFPSEVKFFSYGLRRSEILRVGLCVPKDLTKFDVLSEYPAVIRRNNHTTLPSLRALDDFTDKTTIPVFHDTDNGVIFFKLFSHHDRTNDSQLCCAGFCPAVKFKLLNGNLNKVRNCSEVKTPPYQDPRPRPPKLKIKKICAPGSSQGLGSVRWHEVKKIVHQPVSVPCLDRPSPPDVSREGTSMRERLRG